LPAGRQYILTTAPVIARQHRGIKCTRLLDPIELT
jgi:hypothetical protein